MWCSRQPFASVFAVTVVAIIVVAHAFCAHAVPRLTVHRLYLISSQSQFTLFYVFSVFFLTWISNVIGLQRRSAGVYILRAGTFCVFCHNFIVNSGCVVPLSKFDLMGRCALNPDFAPKIWHGGLCVVYTVYFFRVSTIISLRFNAIIRTW